RNVDPLASLTTRTDLLLVCAGRGHQFCRLAFYSRATVQQQSGPDSGQQYPLHQWRLPVLILWCAWREFCRTDNDQRFSSLEQMDRCWDRSRNQPGPISIHRVTSNESFTTHLQSSFSKALKCAYNHIALSSSGGEGEGEEALFSVTFSHNCSDEIRGFTR